MALLGRILSFLGKNDGQEVDFLSVIGFTLDDIESAEITYYQGDGSPSLYKLPLDQVKEHLSPLTKTHLRYERKISEYQHKILIILKHGGCGNNVGKLRRLKGDSSCGQLILCLALSACGDCIYVSRFNQDHQEIEKYYSPSLLNFKAFLEKPIALIVS